MKQHKSQEWFSIPIVVEKILQHFNHQELLSLSLVNKTWNFEAKTLLKLRGNTTAVIGMHKQLDWDTALCYLSEISPEIATPAVQPLLVTPQRNSRPRQDACHEFGQFVQILDAMTIVPFSELRINAPITHSTACEPLDRTTMNRIASRLAVRILRLVRLCHNEESSPEGLDTEELVLEKPCNAMEIFNLILEVSASHLTELSVVISDHNSVGRLGDIPSSLYFPQLKMLTFYVPRWGWHKDQSLLADFLNNVVRNSPNLEEFHWDHLCDDSCQFIVGVRDVEEIWISELEGRQALFVVHKPAWDDVPKNLMQQVAVRSIHLCIHQLNNGYTNILRNSRTTLRKADLEIFFLEQILLDELPYTRLLVLELCITFSASRDEYKALLRSPIWKQRFPALEDITIRIQRESEYEVEANERTAEKESMNRLMSELACRSWADEEDDSVWPEIEFLSIDGGDTDVTAIDCEFVGRLFPNVKCLRLVSLAVRIILPSFFSTMTHIEELRLETVDYSRNVDGTLCGIHDEEVEQLREMETKYLKAVHIVPIQPPLTFLRSLKFIKFDLIVNDYDGRDDRLAISRVSAGICFSRMPGLTIAFDSRREYMSKMMNEFPEVNVEGEYYHEYRGATEDAGDHAETEDGHPSKGGECEPSMPEDSHLFNSKGGDYSVENERDRQEEDGAILH